MLDFVICIKMWTRTTSVGIIRCWTFSDYAWRFTLGGTKTSQVESCFGHKHPWGGSLYTGGMLMNALPPLEMSWQQPWQESKNQSLYIFVGMNGIFPHCKNYIGSEVEINVKMRDILADWLIEVHNKCELISKSLYLTLHIINCYLSMEAVLRRDLQLVRWAPCSSPATMKRYGLQRWTTS